MPPPSRRTMTRRWPARYVRVESPCVHGECEHSKNSIAVTTTAAEEGPCATTIGCVVDAASIAEDFADLKITIRFSEGVPNLEARDDIKITDIGADRADDRRSARRGRVGAAALELARAEQAAGLQLPLRRSGIRIEPMPDRRGRLLRVHRPERPDEEAQGQVAVYQTGRADLLHSRHLARHPGRGRGLHHADHASPARTSPRITTGRSSSWTAMPGPSGSTLRCRPHR